MSDAELNRQLVRISKPHTVMTKARAPWHPARVHLCMAQMLKFTVRSFFEAHLMA